MTPGTILILNGTSSAGKSTLLRAVQGAMEMPFLDAGLDKFLFMLPRPYLNDAALWQQVMEPTRSGPIGLQLIRGMHRSIAGLAQAGNCVAADHVLIDPRWLQDCAAVLGAEPRAYLIGVRCPLEVVEQRERDRKDRTLGQARQQYDLVHAHGVYDFEVDTAAASPEECAAQIKAFLERGEEPRALRQLSQHRSPLERVRRICQALPETEERLSHGEPTFFVRKKVYAMFADHHHGDERVAVWVPAPAGMQSVLIESAPETYFRPPYVGGRGWIGINLASVTDDELEYHLLEAWRLIAPKRLQNPR